MIGESEYWKTPLLETATRLREAIGKEDLPEETCAQLERDIFIGFYSIRKLFEATGKVSESTRSKKISLKWYPKLSDAPIVDWYNRNELWTLYDMNCNFVEKRDILYVSHRFVHSFIFSQCASCNCEGDIGDGVFFTSDRDKENRINFIHSVQVIEIFEIVGSDYPRGFRCWRDPQTGEMKWSV